MLRQKSAGGLGCPVKREKRVVGPGEDAEAFTAQYGGENGPTLLQQDVIGATPNHVLMQRRKGDVMRGRVPPKREMLVQIELTAIQKQVYRAVYEKNFRQLQLGEVAKGVTNVSMELRKICNHPFLVDGLEEKFPQPTADAAMEQLLQVPRPATRRIRLALSRRKTDALLRHRPKFRQSLRLAFR